MPTTPLVTVAMPVYNGERYIADAVTSFLAQDLEDLELVVCDNASTDATLDVVRELAAEDHRVRHLTSDVNRGATWNFNRAFDAGRGRYFKWAAHDDMVRPSLLSRSVAVLDRDPSVAVVYPRTSVIDERGAVVGDFHDGLDLRESRPAARLARLLASQTEYHPIWGLMRRDQLARTRLGAYPGADIVLLAEQVLLGRCHELDDRLFLRRFHAETSINANPEAADISAWFDPGRRRPVRLKTWRLTAELLRATARAPLAAADRAAAAAAVLRSWAGVRRRDLAGELKRELVGAIPRSGHRQVA